MFLIAIVLGLAAIAAIGYALIYLAVLWVWAVFGSSCLIAFLVLYAVLGENNSWIAILGAIPFGACMVFLYFKRFSE